MTLHSPFDAVTEPCAADGAQPRRTERRDSPRVDLNVGVGFRSDASFYTGFTQDISEAGLFVATHMLQPVGAELTLTFALPTGPEISVRGVVRWQRDPHESNALTPPGMGVQFRDLSDADLERIRHFVAQREPLLFEA